MSIRKVFLGNGDSKWEVRVHENGRGSKRVTRRFDKKAEAEEFAQDFKSKARRQELGLVPALPDQPKTFGEIALLWLQQGELKFSASHLLRVKGILAELLPMYGDISIHEMDAKRLVEIQIREKAKGSANATSNRKTEVVNAILNFAVASREIAFNPAGGFKKFKRKSEEMQFWEKPEAMSFLKKMNETHPPGSDSRWRYVVYLAALNTGLRAGEIWGLQPQDLNPDRESFWIRRQYNRVTLAFTPTKGQQARHVPAAEHLVNELDALVVKHGLRKTDTYFRNEAGKPVCHDNFSDRTFAKDLKIWGGRKVRFHDLRHTAATLMISSNVNLHTVKEILGHKDIRTTMEYAHLLSGSVGQVAKTFSLSGILAASERKGEAENKDQAE